MWAQQQCSAEEQPCSWVLHPSTWASTARVSTSCHLNSTSEFPAGTTPSGARQAGWCCFLFENSPYEQRTALLACAGLAGCVGWLQAESGTVFPLPLTVLLPASILIPHRLLLPLDSIVSATPAGDVLNIRFASGQPDLLLQVRGAAAAAACSCPVPISVHSGTGAV